MTLDVCLDVLADNPADLCDARDANRASASRRWLVVDPDSRSAPSCACLHARRRVARPRFDARSRCASLPRGATDAATTRAPRPCACPGPPRPAPRASSRRVAPGRDPHDKCSEPSRVQVRREAPNRVLEEVPDVRGDRREDRFVPAGTACGCGSASHRLRVGARRVADRFGFVPRGDEQELALRTEEWSEDRASLGQ